MTDGSMYNSLGKISHSKSLQYSSFFFLFCADKVNFIYLKRKAQIEDQRFPLSPSHKEKVQPITSVLCTWGHPFLQSQEDARCHLFSCRDTWDIHPRKSWAFPRMFWNFSFPTGNPTVSSAHESDNRLEPVSREAGSSGGYPVCVESKEEGSLTASLHTRHTVGIPVGRQRAQLQATTKHPPTSDLPSAAVSDRCPALYCRW